MKHHLPGYHAIFNFKIFVSSQSQNSNLFMKMSSWAILLFLKDCCSGGLLYNLMTHLVMEYVSHLWSRSCFILIISCHKYSHSFCGTEIRIVLSTQSEFQLSWDISYIDNEPLVYAHVSYGRLCEGNLPQEYHKARWTIETSMTFSPQLTTVQCR